MCNSDKIQRSISGLSFNGISASAYEKWTKESVGKMDDSIQDIFGNKRYIKFEKAVAKLFWEKSDMFAEILTQEEKEKYVIDISGDGEDA